ncbi:hypothetical protein DPMN_176050 [Dreissena polymorpha]|uniref:Uncharacterized protein n=1 Tax=Dreissena polymorpha TaxID=45954 RepID=A0A9D4IIT7_DREPO|nr:hypothetical protein DPMN_176050 [Dreissena polymorpha]
MATGRSPRSKTHLADNLQDHEFVKLLLLLLLLHVRSYECADRVKLSEYLWSATTKDQTAALESGFVQGIKNGTLNPEAFGNVLM